MWPPPAPAAGTCAFKAASRVWGGGGGVTTVPEAGVLSHRPPKNVSSRDPQSYSNPTPSTSRGSEREEVPWNDPECVTIGGRCMLPRHHPLLNTSLAHPANPPRTAVSGPRGPWSVPCQPVRVGYPERESPFSLSHPHVSVSLFLLLQEAFLTSLSLGLLHPHIGKIS
uniref:Uncharacterized protein n=1 Tax=Rousettus aegyptiacus TaxID=9407 RepID=A0A7J8D738_ROUAE|nr:hypothetical protein HJG63_008781 [Rousettus aegyptiacus]